MSQDLRGLGIIFAVFLGLLLTTLLVLVAHTLYPQPAQVNEQIDALYEEEWAIQRGRPLAELTEEEQARLKEIRDSREELAAAQRTAYRRWERVFGLALIVLATFVMAVSLVRPGRLPVISSGLLLGGVFTMAYGVGWTVFTEPSVGKVLTVAGALAVTLFVGYLRFVRRQGEAKPFPPPHGSAQAADLAALEARVRDLEQRLAETARVLGQNRR